MRAVSVAFSLGGLTLEVATRDAAGGVHLLVEVDGQREEVVVLALLGDDHGIEHRGVALLDQTAPVACLASSPDSKV